jgi:CheY-like chemotaxis protein
MKRDLRVFIVDDVPIIAYTISEVLRDRGYSVIPYIDPVQALRDAHSLLPDVLISDVDMPDLSGVDLAIQLQAQCPACKVLLMSGHIGPIASLESARRQGFQFPLFAKPVSAQTFVEQLEVLSETTIQSSHAACWNVQGLEH